jgi:hypothetical protein
MRGMIDVRADDPHLEAPDAVALTGDEGDVVDAGDRAVGVRARERGLHLARHQLRGGVAHEVAHVRAGVRRRVERLVVADAGPRVGGHVAHGVAAALAAGEPGVRDLADQRGGVAQRHVVDLDVLPGGDVALVEGRVLLHHVGERLHLLRRDAAERQLDADHLHVGLPLAVDALLEAEADELVLGYVAGEELLRLVVEVVELAGEDRDDVSGHVFADLGVLDRPHAAARGRWLHQAKIPNPNPNQDILN